jgi:hypothetical protein
MRLLSRLDAALPVFARLSPDMAAAVRKESPQLELPEQARITRVDYAGDESGIVCWLDLGGPEGGTKFVASITHLRFDPRHVLAREIAAYQKHRLKRIRKETLLAMEFDQALARLCNAGLAPRLRLRVPSGTVPGLAPEGGFVTG